MTNAKDLNFTRQLIIISVIIFLAASYPVYKYASLVQFYSILSGYLIGLLNALVGYKLNNMAFKKSVKLFMVIVFGGMGIRMLFIAVTILTLLYIAKLDEVSLVASVFFFYILFVSLEILYLHKRQLLEKAAKSHTDSKTQV